MAIEIEVTGFTGLYATLNAPAASHPVGMAEIVNRCLTVGGPVLGSPRQRTYRRSGIANAVLSSVHPVGAAAVTSDLEVTTLYQNTETTEKTGLSFRLGMGFAAIAASRVLDIPALLHVVVPGAPTNGRRADLIGLDKGKATHIVEAKARSHGVTNDVIVDGKAQAVSTWTALTAAGSALATASIAVSDLSSSPVRVLLADPPVQYSGGGDDAARRAEERRLSNEFYRPVIDLLEVKQPERSGFDDIDESSTGSWLPGSDVWLGLRDEVRAELSSGHRSLREGVEAVQVADAWLTSTTSDGHVIVLGPRALASD